jgi:cell division protein FtsB
MHIPPAVRRWGLRFGLAIVVAIVIGYLPGQILVEDPRAAMLRSQIDELDAQARDLAAGNAALTRETTSLQHDIGAIERRARADLGMVYPDEIVVRVVKRP